MCQDGDEEAERLLQHLALMPAVVALRGLTQALSGKGVPKPATTPAAAAPAKASGGGGGGGGVGGGGGQGAAPSEHLQRLRAHIAALR